MPESGSVSGPTRKAHEPTVTIDGLTEGTDFEVAYRDNVDAGTATAIATGIGGYAGTIQREFTIAQAENAITASDITLNASASKKQTRSLGATATGGTLAYQSNVAKVAVSADGTVTVAKNYAGKATVTITAGDANYKTATRQVTVTVRQIANTITLPAKLARTASAKAQSFPLGAKRKGKGNLTYASNNKKVAVDASGKVTVAKGFVGAATITVKVAASEIYKAASAKTTVVVSPPATKVASVKAAKGGKAKVAWDKVALGGGYEVQYATNKKFSKGAKKVVVKKSATVSTTLSGLKAKKTYYVRVRALKKVGGKTYYSAWSAAKSVKAL